MRDGAPGREQHAHGLRGGLLVQVHDRGGELENGVRRRAALGDELVDGGNGGGLGARGGGARGKRGRRRRKVRREVAHGHQRGGSDAALGGHLVEHDPGRARGG